jgi:hypothetical protein
MSGHDPLRKALLKSFDWIALVQSPERWSRLEGTAAGGPDGVTPRAMGLREGSASVRVLRMGRTGTDKERQEAQVNNSGHGVFSTGFGGISGGRWRADGGAVRSVLTSRRHRMGWAPQAPSMAHVIVAN